MSRIYLDYNSTTPTLPEVVEAMRPYFTTIFGNPASAHRAGAAARQGLEEARETVARDLCAHPDEVYFTSGATEANNLALFGLEIGSGHVLTSPVEHPSVVEPVRELANGRVRIELLPVDECGTVVPEAVRRAVNDGVGLITIQAANHETGTLQDIAALAAAAPGVPFHTDATQAVGKVPVDFHRLGVTSLACSGHKLYGPKGVGVLLVRRRTRLRPRSFGGHQQQGVRPGTEPVALAVGLATALRLAVSEMEARRAHVTTLRNRFLDALQATAAPLILNGAQNGLPHTLNVSFSGCPAELLLIRLDLAGVDCSTGSACSSGSLLPSPVLQAMGCSPERLGSAMRFSLSHLMEADQIDDAACRVAAEVAALRSSTSTQSSS